LGDDTLFGGIGNDTLSFASFINPLETSGITFDNTISTAQDTGAGADKIEGFETVIGSNHNDNFTIRGQAFDANDVRSLFAGDGDDSVTETYLLDDDFVDGGDGSDTYIYGELGYDFFFDMSTGLTQALIVVSTQQLSILKMLLGPMTQIIQIQSLAQTRPTLYRAVRVMIRFEAVTVMTSCGGMRAMTRSTAALA